LKIEACRDPLSFLEINDKSELSHQGGYFFENAHRTTPAFRLGQRLTPERAGTVRHQPIYKTFYPKRVTQKPRRKLFDGPGPTARSVLTRTGFPVLLFLGLF
jgi:hypothetical protein